MSDYYLRMISDYSRVIKDNTYGTLQRVDKLPDTLDKLMVAIINWQQPDTTQSTSDIQGQFTSATQSSFKNISDQIRLQQELEIGFFTSPVTGSTVSYSKDMSYSSLLPPALPPESGQQPKPQCDGGPACNYIKNVAGLSFQHAIPAGPPNWAGGAENINAYTAFYKAVSAIQAFDAYVLGQSYIEAKNNFQPYGVQLELIKKASSSDWLSLVSSEPIGNVLRQILMFNSQMYVVLTELLQTQKQLLASQAMNNTLLVIGNQFTESQLLDKARKPAMKIPGGG
jgi:hypothetical protein